MIGDWNFQELWRVNSHLLGAQPVHPVNPPAVPPFIRSTLWAIGSKRHPVGTHGRPPSHPSRPRRPRRRGQVRAGQAAAILLRGDHRRDEHRRERRGPALLPGAPHPGLPAPTGQTGGDGEREAARVRGEDGRWRSWY